MKTFFRCAAAAACACLMFAGGAAYAAGGADDGWSGKAGLGYLATTGNSETTTLNANFDLAYDWQKWRHTLGLLAVGADNDGTSTAERYALNLKTQYDFTEFDYLFGRYGYDKDRFSGVDLKSTATVGYGRRLINTDIQILNVEAGVGYQQLDFADGTDDASAVLRLGGDYKYVFNANTTFDQLLAVEIAADNTATESVSAITAKLAETLNLVLSLTVKNNSDVPAGLDKTDTFTAVNIEYGF